MMELVNAEKMVSREKPGRKDSGDHLSIYIYIGLEYA